VLELLKEYALTHGLEPEPGFKPKDVRWAIAFHSTKGLLGVQELGNADQKKNPGITFNKCPDLIQSELISGGTTRSHFLVDTPGVVTLYGDPADAKQQKKHKYFVGLLMEAGRVAPELREIAGYLSDETTLCTIRNQMEQLKVKPNEKVTFLYDGHFPLELNAWHDWWRSFRMTLREKPAKGGMGDANMRCFITGQMVRPVATHSKIERLADVGGQPSGDALVCFDKEAFQSYGLEQAANAAVSEEAMNAYRAGLNHLIKETGQRLVGAKVIHWFKEKVPLKDDPMLWLNGIEGIDEQTEISAQERANELLESIRTGKRADLANNRYYALTLSGQSGRVMLRDWMEGNFTELARNIIAWFDDLNIVQKDGTAITKPPKLLNVLGATARELDDLSAPLVAKVWRVAVKGEAIPYFILSQTLIRAKAAIIQGDSPRTTGMGLIKAYHNRRKRKEANNTLDKMLQPALNENYPSQAYQCGRLMALLAELQRAALGDVGAGVVQRYYAAASTTPALVLGRLTRTSQYHLGKLDPKLAWWYDNKISKIWSGISNGIPTTLNLEEQSLFAMGYYQQLATLRAPKSSNDNMNEKEQ
jgi:CRISPR-associated protein Csd1